MSAARTELLTRLADLIEAVRRPHPVRVAIDGVDAAGKTTLANEVAEVLRARRRHVIRGSIDGFHRPRALRRQRGELSPYGYYADSFDTSAVRTFLLDPLGPDGDLRYRSAVYDYRADRPVETPPVLAVPDSVLVFDGVFLLRPELRAAWDLRLFVSVGFAEILRRATRRDADLFGDVAQVKRRYHARYLPGQRLYLAAERPAYEADGVVYNDDPARPCMRMRTTSR
ncbi:AAA family ATPase [Actinopolymorpha sp. B17G11]|uniref:AAA family ATPase n=1 Tax=Actinopolymorpha sp. B17G11 TaxID=3160861 RepID=UPI0032E438F5